MHEFLKELSEFANLVLFTAGLEGLAVNLRFILLSSLIHGFIYKWLTLIVICVQVMQDLLLTKLMLEIGLA